MLKERCRKRQFERKKKQPKKERDIMIIMFSRLGLKRNK